jgi:peptide/nickel transport system permease protein
MHKDLSISKKIFYDSWQNNFFKFSVIFFIFICLFAFIYPEISNIKAEKMNIKSKFLPPIFFEGFSWKHLLGTDQLGRDMLMRCLVGLRFSLIIGFTSVFIMLLFGCLVGIISGFKSSWVDIMIMRITDAQLSIPMVILAISILGVTRPNLASIILVLALSGWPLYARVSRSMALIERDKEYVRGARILGASDFRIIFLLVIPIIIPPIAFVSVLDIARMMIFEAILGFLGLGVQPPTPTFGNIIADARKYLINAWWIATMPGVFLVITLVTLNFIGSTLEKSKNKIFGEGS